MEAVAALVDLTDHLHKRVHLYSGGMKRRMSLAAALLHEPQLLILDEPTVGIDPLLRRTIWQELRKLRDNGTTIIVTTHVIDEAEQCEQLALIRDGRLIASDSPSGLKNRAQAETLEQAFLSFGGEAACASGQ